MGTKFAVVSSNLVPLMKNLRCLHYFNYYIKRFRRFFIRNYFRFQDDIFHKWFDHFDIEPFDSMINNLNPDLKFLFEYPPKSLNFLDINIWTVENNLVFNIDHKPTNSFNYSTYKSCHPPHTKNNMSLFISQTYCSYSNDK